MSSTRVRRLKDQSGWRISLGGVRLPVALAAAGLIDEYTFIVHLLVDGRRPRLFDGVELTLERIEWRAFVRALRCSGAALPSRVYEALPGHSESTDMLHIRPNRSVKHPEPGAPRRRRERFDDCGIPVALQLGELERHIETSKPGD